MIFFNYLPTTEYLFVITNDSLFYFVLVFSSKYYGENMFIKFIVFY